MECHYQRLSLGSRLEKARAVNQHRGEESFRLRLFGDVAMTPRPGFGGLGYARRARLWRVNWTFELKIKKKIIKGNR